MLLSRRRLFLGLGASGALAACGFTPAYAPGGVGTVLQNSVEVAEPMDKPAFDLVKRLEQRLGPPQPARFGLSYAIRLNPLGVAITTENAVTRFNLTGNVEWALTDLATGKKLTGGKVSSFTSYSATGSTVAGLAAEEDAALRLMRILADQIISTLLATSGQWAGNQAKAIGG
jgi:LPS-assembly lipoprotein